MKRGVRPTARPREVMKLAKRRLLPAPSKGELRAVERLKRAGLLIHVGRGLWAFRTPSDDLDRHVARRFGTKKRRAKSARTGARK
jgi:hypothetical protein